MATTPTPAAAAAAAAAAQWYVYIYILSYTLILKLILVNLPTNDGWDKWGFETMNCVLNPQVCFSLFYIFDYINEHLKETIPANRDVRHGKEGIWGPGTNGRRVSSPDCFFLLFVISNLLLG